MHHREEQHNMHELMRARWSPRSFSSQLLTKGQIESLFQAARWAPSSGNGQPWRFVFATKDQPESFNRLVELLEESNAVWAKHAPFLMVVFSKTTRGSNDKPHPGHLYDTGLAMGQLCLQATALGLQVHQMGGFAMDKANEALQVPADYQPIAMAAIGQAVVPTHLSEELQHREQTKSIRKPLQETVHAGTWLGTYQEIS